MKKFQLKTIAAVLLLAVTGFTACKSKKADPSAADTSVTTIQQADTSGMSSSAAPVTISPDDSLTMMTKDAVKDYPGVTAAVNNGEVTLTGNITRDKLPKLMMAVSAMHPKKINNNLTINK